MKTTTVPASELGDDWTPAAHMLRAVTAIKNVREGDVIRVRDHRDPQRGEGERRWHKLTVTGTENDRATVILGTDKWPIAYVASADELVELVDIRRQVEFRCVICTRNDHQDKTKITVTLEAFLDDALQKQGGLHVVILPDLTPREQTGYCKEHGTDFLS